jgi:hypothetical protein
VRSNSNDHIQGPSSLLSTLDIASDWVLLGCTDSPELQIVTAVCSTPEADPGSQCSAVFEADAKNTYYFLFALVSLAKPSTSIVKMPKTCGPSPYARLAQLEVSTTRTLPDQIATTLPAGNPVYELHFDFNFHLLSETRDAADGEVLVRGVLVNHLNHTGTDTLNLTSSGRHKSAVRQSFRSSVF